jgi:alpha-beta hydrolase superfamily lysophospholipase
MDQIIRNVCGERLDCSFHLGAPHHKNIVVIGHGVTGHKDRPLIIALAEGLATAGFHVLRHSWSGNGESEGNFADSNITKEVADLGAILAALSNEGYTIAYAGHSMGGAVGVRRAVIDPRIRLLISLAGIVHTAEFAHHAFGHLEAGVGLMFEKPGLVLPAAYMEDLRAIETVLDDTSRVAVPWLLVHGTADDLVPIQHSRDAYSHATSEKKLVEIPQADHLFGPDQTESAVAAVVAWCREQFARL